MLSAIRWSSKTVKTWKSIFAFVMAGAIACVPAVGLIPCTGSCGCPCCLKTPEACCSSVESPETGAPSTCCGDEANVPCGKAAGQVPAIAAPGLAPCQCTSLPNIPVPLNNGNQNTLAASGAAMRPAGIAPVMPGAWPAGSPSRRPWNAEVSPHLFYCVFLC